MSATVRDWMQSEVRTVPPDLSLAELEERFLQHRVTGFPVAVGGRLLGIVSRSDVVRQLSVEQAWAETLSDYYHDWTGMAPEGPSLAEIGAEMGRRIEGMHVEDVMVKAPITVGPDEGIAAAARLLVERRIHRVPVVEGGRLVGILTSLDLARLVAERLAD
jgi:CBS domain-containing protein